VHTTATVKKISTCKQILTDVERYPMISRDEIEERLNSLSEVARERMKGCTILVGHYCEIDFLTKEELEIRHELILSLPTFSEEREAAKVRIKERLDKRKKNLIK